MPPRMPKGPIKKAKKGTFKRLLKYMFRDYKFQYLIVLACIIINSVAVVKASLFLKTLIDDHITPLMSAAAPNYSGLVTALMKMAGIYLLGIAAGYTFNRVMAWISQSILRNLRRELFDHMQTLPIRYFDSHPRGDVMSVYTNDVDTMRQMIGQSLPQIVSSVVSVISALVAMLTTNVLMTLLVLVCVFFMTMVTKKIAGMSGKHFIAQQRNLGAMNGYIEEMVAGQKVVKVFCHEEQAKEEFDRRNEALFDSANKAHRYAGILMPIMSNLGNIQYALVAIGGGAMAVAGLGISLGTIASFLQLSKSFSRPISQVSQQFNSIIMALAGAERVFDLLDEESEQDNGTVTLVNARYDENGELTETDERTELWAWKCPDGEGNYTYRKLTGDVRFFDVDFSYEEDKLVLENISLFAKPGQKLAFVGATGAGKTTITNLINRFYDIADGKIQYDGININEIRKDDLRHSLGIVLQETCLFTGTVRENIRYGRLDATDEEVEAAAVLAGADDFIRRLPQGYETELTGNGANLSQGQRQLLAIARAAVADPPVMILDEATSSIDTRTEALVQAGMDSLMTDRTVFVIAHRLSTVRNSDAIIVLDHGKIVERGDHDDLIAQKGIYYQLYTGAFELE